MPSCIGEDNRTIFPGRTDFDSDTILPAIWVIKCLTIVFLSFQVGFKVVEFCCCFSFLFFVVVVCLIVFVFNANSQGSEMSSGDI